MKLEGTFTALVTPFSEGGDIDEAALRRLVRRNLDGGVTGLVPCGTTGETHTLTADEIDRVISIVRDESGGACPIIAGSGTNATSSTIANTKRIRDLGCDAALIVTPYYNKPSQEGLFAHFSAIAKRTEKPIVLYSIPSRCGIEISTDTVKRLRENHPHICALKEAGGRSSKVSETVVALDSDFTVLSGDDGLTLPFMACGAKGVVSVASNLIPQKVVSLVSLALEGKFMDAQKVHLENYNFFTDIFCEPNPVPIKTLLHLKNVISSAEVRLPLSPASSSNQQLLEKIASDL